MCVLLCCIQEQKKIKKKLCDIAGKLVKISIALLDRSQVMVKFIK